MMQLEDGATRRPYALRWAVALNWAEMLLKLLTGSGLDLCLMGYISYFTSYYMGPEGRLAHTRIRC
jgi:hypothetical protein